MVKELKVNLLKSYSGVYARVPLNNAARDFVVTDDGTLVFQHFGKKHFNTWILRPDADSGDWGSFENGSPYSIIARDSVGHLIVVDKQEGNDSILVSPKLPIVFKVFDTNFKFIQNVNFDISSYGVGLMDFLSDINGDILNGQAAVTINMRQTTIAHIFILQDGVLTNKHFEVERWSGDIGYQAYSGFLTPTQFVQNAFDYSTGGRGELRVWNFDFENGLSADYERTAVNLYTPGNAVDFRHQWIQPYYIGDELVLLEWAFDAAGEWRNYVIMYKKNPSGVFEPFFVSNPPVDIKLGLFPRVAYINNSGGKAGSRLCTWFAPSGETPNNCVQFYEIKEEEVIQRPTISVPEGPYYEGMPVSVTIEGLPIWGGQRPEYRLNNELAWKDYFNPIEITQTTTVYARQRVVTEGMPHYSDEVEKHIEFISNPVKPPIITVPEGIHYEGDTVPVTITSPTPEATLYYKFDSETEWKPYIEFEVNKNTTVQARAEKNISGDLFFAESKLFIEFVVKPKVPELTFRNIVKTDSGLPVKAESRQAVIDSKGNTYIQDKANYEIYKYDKNGNRTIFPSPNKANCMISIDDADNLIFPGQGASWVQQMQNVTSLYVLPAGVEDESQKVEIQVTSAGNGRLDFLPRFSGDILNGKAAAFIPRYRENTLNVWLFENGEQTIETLTIQGSPDMVTADNGTMTEITKLDANGWPAQVMYYRRNPRTGIWLIDLSYDEFMMEFSVAKYTELVTPDMHATNGVGVWTLGDAQFVNYNTGSGYYDGWRIVPALDFDAGIISYDSPETTTATSGYQTNWVLIRPVNETKAVGAQYFPGGYLRTFEVTANVPTPILPPIIKVPEGPHYEGDTVIVNIIPDQGFAEYRLNDDQNWHTVYQPLTITQTTTIHARQRVIVEGMPHYSDEVEATVEFIPVPKLEAPTIEVTEKTVTGNPRTVTITSNFPEAKLYYLASGNTYMPYEGPFEVYQNCVVKAKATYKYDTTYSELPIDFYDKLESIVIDAPDYAYEGQAIKVKIISNPANATKTYKVNDGDLKIYDGPFTVTATSTILANATYDGGQGLQVTKTITFKPVPVIEKKYGSTYDICVDILARIKGDPQFAPKDGKWKVVNGTKFGGSKWTAIPEKLDFQDVTDYNAMFMNCKGLTTVTLDMAKATDAMNMFFGCDELMEVTIMAPKQPFEESYMFANCPKLTSINISGTLPDQDYNLGLEHCPLNGGNVDIILQALPETTVEGRYIMIGQSNLDAALPSFVDEARRKGWELRVEAAK